MWILLIVSVFGIMYAVFIGLFFFVSQLAFVSYVRGSGVRLGPDQFPQLHARVVQLSRAMDPFDGLDYGYDAAAGRYRLWSSGPDGEPGTEDDLSLEGPARLRVPPT